VEKWSVEVDKEAFKYSSAHFLIFPDGSAERLHGHNYRVFVALQGTLSEFGLVFDFNKIKPIVKGICDELDEQWLIPGKHPVLKWESREDGIVEVRYLERYYAAPQEDVTILPINNTSVENMSAWFGGELRRRVEVDFPDITVERLEVAIEETPGQRARWCYALEEKG